MTTAARMFRKSGSLPGFSLALGWTLFWLTAIVLIPLTTLAVKSAELGFGGFARLLSDGRVTHALALSIVAASIAASIDAVFGLLIAYVLTRYSFPGRKLLDAAVDLPFALPTSVAGISLAALWAENGWIGAQLARHGLKVAYTPVGIIVALVFVGLPFVVRTVQPVIAEMDRELEQAADSLGANPFQIATRVVLPPLFPAVLTGFGLALARGIGEYGSVIFIAGNMPKISEIAPLLIVVKLEEYDVAGATGIAVLMLLSSFAILFTINFLQGRLRRRLGHA
jgi:sulfate transport system permease protein